MWWVCEGGCGVGCECGEWGGCGECESGVVMKGRCGIAMLLNLLPDQTFHHPALETHNTLTKAS